MDGEMPSLPNQQENPLQEPEQPKQKEGLLKALGILEVGLIEVMFVGVVIALLFGTLNYFNILRLSELFPSYLGFLPLSLLVKPCKVHIYYSKIRVRYARKEIIEK